MKIVLYIDILLWKMLVAFKIIIRDWRFALLQTDPFVVFGILIILVGFFIVNQLIAILLLWRSFFLLLL